eukprot:1976201-Alexandrium_andersonii.AAC.1
MRRGGGHPPQTAQRHEGAGSPPASHLANRPTRGSCFAGGGRKGGRGGSLCLLYTSPSPRD